MEEKIEHINLTPFNYHKKLKDHFKSRKKTWEWFSENTNKEKQVTEFKTSLLKNSYRLNQESHQELYKIVDEICKKLTINANVTLYQEHNSVQLNAGISIINNEAHIVFSGNIISLLSNDEMKALLAHELSHYLFYKIENEEYEITQRIILALANDQMSENSMIETARIFQLYMELFCDAGALQVCGDYKTVIQMLVKLNTSLSEVNANSYLEQAKEIINSDDKSTTNQTHPESYIRSLALYYQSEQVLKSGGKIKKLIEGDLDLNTLDVFKQKQLFKLTKDFIQLIIKPKWMNTSSVLNLCNQYFKDFYKEKFNGVENLVSQIEESKISVKNYFCYVLLDFAKVDNDMEGAPFGHTLEIAELLNLKKEYEKIVRKELKLTVRDFKILQEKLLLELQDVKEAKEDSIYD